MHHLTKNVYFYCSDDEQPIYECPPPKYSAERVLEILLDPAIDTSRVCTSKPIAITSSSTFVVDISKLANPDDIKVDNFGIWKYSGSHPQQYRVYVDEDGHVEVDKCAPGATGNNVVYRRRLHSVHPSNKEFKRMIAFISGKLYSFVYV